MSRPLRALAAVLAMGAGVCFVPSSPAQAADSHSPIAGSGSSWSANAVNQWVADVQPNGLQVVFTGSGSAIGRQDFANQTTDFGVTDIGYQGVDEATGQNDTSQGRQFAYLPIVAGGTAFPYNLKVAGKRVTDLRLSGLTITKIFTNQITNWDDKEITADNNGHALPSTPIIPVVHTEGSGSSAQFTRYMDAEYPSIWRPFQGSSGGTEYFPRKGDAIAQDGSDQVMNYVATDAANGAISYDEYSYALGKGFPVVKVENANHYFTLPTADNVAVALVKAKINMDTSSPNYLLQDLTNVYTDPDNRAYPLSSYSYMIIPTASNDSRMTTAKRQTLADYLYYGICDGQKEIGPIGYSPLPINLAEASFQQIAKLKQADPNVDLQNRDISTCNNPTFIKGQPNKNYLAEIAPQPPACDKTGAGPCGTAAAISPTTSSAGGTAAGGSSSTGTSAATTGGSTARGTTGAATTTTGGTGGALSTSGTKTVVDPVTGQVSTVAAQQAGAVDLTGTPTELASGHGPVSSTVLGPLAILLLIAAIVVPPLLSRRLRSSGPQA